MTHSQRYVLTKLSKLSNLLPKIVVCQPVFQKSDLKIRFNLCFLIRKFSILFRENQETELLLITSFSSSLQTQIEAVIYLRLHQLVSDHRELPATSASLSAVSKFHQRITALRAWPCLSRMTSTTHPRCYPLTTKSPGSIGSAASNHFVYCSSVDTHGPSFSNTNLPGTGRASSCHVAWQRTVSHQRSPRLHRTT